MTTPPTAPRRRWLWAVIAASATLLIAGGVVVGLLIANGRVTETPQPTIEPSIVPMPSSTPAIPPPTAAGVDGCLGGDSRGPEAVLDAQSTAAQTPEGAVSFAIAFTRWLGQKPAVPADEIALLEGAASLAPNLAESAASAENVDVAQFHLTSLNGYYRIESFSDVRVDLTLMLPLVVQGAIDPTLNFMPSFGVVWTEQGWAIKDGEFREDANTLRTTGVAIPGGC